ncbi:MAG: glycosyltransferase family 2 protein [Actinomycetota bacterium]
MAERPRVDVGVVTWNTAELTGRALRRLLDTDQGCELRVLVRDNASSDGTPEWLAREVPEAEIEVGRENLGFAAGVNRLLARSRAPWLFLLNSDAWPRPGAIRTLVDTALDHPRAAAVAPRIEDPEGNLERSTYPFPSLRVAAATLGPRWPGRWRIEQKTLVGAWAHDRPRPVDWAIGAALLLRRDAVDEVGGFDERFFMYVEDLEWCWRARRRGWEIRFDPAAVVAHVGNVSGSLAFGDRRTEAYMRNTYRFYRREHGALETLAYRSLNLLAGGVRYAAARVGRDASLARYWRTQIAANLTRAAGNEMPRTPEV